MAVAPVVRYMILCQDWSSHPENANRLDITGLLSNIDSFDDPSYPVLLAELCCIVALTECRGAGVAWLECINDATQQREFRSPTHRIELGTDPLAVIIVPFRIRNCRFREPGVYTFRFWFDDMQPGDCPLRLR